MKKICTLCGQKAKLFVNNISDDRYGAPGLYNIYRCEHCGFGFINSKIKSSEIGEFYNKYYPLSIMSPEQVKNSAVIKSAFYTWLIGANNVSHLYIKPHSSVLDIGSASGQSLIEISRLKGKAFGVEPDPSAQKIAKKLKLNVYKGLITDNSFPNKKFDFITASQVIEHDHNPKTFLKAIRKKIEKNGVVILSFPNCDSIYRKIFKKRWINWHVPYHCNFFTKKSFTILANTSGFEIINMKTVTPNIWTILQIRRLLTNPKTGEKNTVWNQKSKQTGINNVAKVFLTIVMLMIIPINRIIDFFGQGDSFLIWLKKHE